MHGEIKYKDITEKIIGTSFEVHTFLGNGFQEVIYQRALAWNFLKPIWVMFGNANKKYFIRNFQNQLE